MFRSGTLAETAKRHRPAVPVAAVDAGTGHRHPLAMASDVVADLRHLRPEIALSWQRSLLCGLTPDEPREPATIPEIDRSSRLLDAARPILEQLADDLSGTDFCLLLANRNACIVDRYSSGPGIARQLDGIGAVVGRPFTEELTGTNSIGTALELRHGVAVNGKEHFIAAMKRFSCYGQPILHPITRRVEAILEITSPVQIAPRLWIPIINRAAKDIEHRLRAGARLAEQRMLAAYEEACGRGRRPVVVLGDNLVLANPAAVDLLHIADHALLREMAAQPGAAPRWEQNILLESGLRSAVTFERIPDSNGAGLFDITVLDRPRLPVPRLAGVSGPSEALSDQLANWRVRRAPLVIAGEAGTGRTTVARQLAGSLPMATVDPITLAKETAAGEPTWPSPGTLLVVDGVGTLPDDVASRLRRLLRDTQTWFALISSPLVSMTGPNAELVSLCLNRVQLQPLRYQQEDFTQIVNEILRRLAPGRTAGLDGRTWNALRGQPWPGNYRELTDVLHFALNHNPAGPLRPEDLPPAYRRVHSKHQLTHLEQVERDTILRMLEDLQGNKARTAHALGIGRTTLYRRLRELGID
ncbi:hypothetical protein E1218_02465 [Kribbella turkmenica]|uniref:Sigma-54 factor interaction domain-containing protein n=1 Tax=Kribbella turkmenica TaxID=2530375 RepID=A0A4V6PDD0_9ACTN|nr:helix-turn-helix domain-containing protein [Kribbella turkmenica]TDD30007.1 hypothetical protein E1218_02465 [Kribbella turkmenica]